MSYIEKITIDSLWNGHVRVEWTLKRYVNVLSGINGGGKTTILHRVASHLEAMAKGPQPADGVILTLSDPNDRNVPFALLSSYEFPKGGMALFQTLMDAYHDSPMRETFMDLVDSLFRTTGKTLVRDSDALMFRQWGETIPAYLLSTGEKKMLYIMLTVLGQRCQPYVLLLDEPEISMHFEWQQRLISIIRQLNPEAQIILTTHSPAVIMDGWADCVTDVEDITR